MTLYGAVCSTPLFNIMNSSSKSMSRKSRKPSNKQNSNLNLRPTTINWNINAGKCPGFINTLSRDNRRYTVMQTSNQGIVLSSNTSVAQLTSKSWTSADIIQFSSYASVFDQYRIDFVEVWLTPYGTATAPGYNGNVHLYSVVDYDDANAPASLVALTQYENCVTTRCTDGHYVKFRPHIAVAGYGGAFTQFINKPSDWIDVASGSLQHFGLKLGAETTVSNADLKVDMETRLTISFRNVF